MKTCVECKFWFPNGTDPVCRLFSQSRPASRPTCPRYEADPNSLKRTIEVMRQANIQMAEEIKLLTAENKELTDQSKELTDQLRHMKFHQTLKDDGMPKWLRKAIKRR